MATVRAVGAVGAAAAVVVPSADHCVRNASGTFASPRCVLKACKLQSQLPRAKRSGKRAQRTCIVTNVATAEPQAPPVVSRNPFNSDPEDPELMSEDVRKKVQSGEGLSVLSTKINMVDLPLGATEDSFKPQTLPDWVLGTRATKKKVPVEEKEKGKEKENEVKETELIMGSDEEDEDEDGTDWPPLVCCFGEALYEFLPSVRVSKKQMHPDIYSTWKGLQWSPPEFARLPGSFPSNVAVALARLGGRVAFMGKVGDDEHGRNIVLELNKNGVQTRAVKFDSSCSTGVARLRLTNQTGQVRMTCVRPSAEDSFLKSEINMDVLKESRFFQFTSFSLTSEPIRSSLFAAIKEAKRNQAEIIFDVNLPLRYWRSKQEARELIQAAWKESSIVEVTKHELEFILGEEHYERLQQKGPEYFSSTVEQTKNRRYHYHYEPEEVAPLWHKKMKILFVTDGTFWIHYYTQHFHGKVAGTEDVLVTPFTCDRTGSGDAVMAGILRKLSTQPELLQDEVKLQKALRFCLCAGIIAQWTKGAIRGMPTESAAQNLTEQVYPHHMIF